MAIISFTHRFVFVKTRKTAGTSVQETLLPVLGPDDVVTHGWNNLLTGERCVIEEFAAVDEIRRHFAVEPERYFKFGFVRNPYAITLSRYFYQIKRNRLAGPASPAHFNQWVQSLYFVGEPGFPGGWYLLDRSRLLLFDQALRPLVDFIGRFESLESDFAHAVHTVGLPRIPLVHVNRSNVGNHHYADWFDEPSKRLVATGFDFELEYFGYRF